MGAKALSPFCVFGGNYMKIKVGDEFPTNEGCRVEVVEDRKGGRFLVKQMDEHQHLSNVTQQQLRLGRVKNPYHPSVCGVGFVGEGDHKVSVNRKMTPPYSAWWDMLKRCYSQGSLERSPTYFGCFVAEDWHNFQNFSKWFEENYREGWELDKDLFIRGNKEYSEATCLFVPPQINSLLNGRRAVRGTLPQGVTKHKDKFRARVSVDGKRECLGLHPTEVEAFAAYKLYKEENVKRVAEKWRDRIDSRVYEALINWEVSIDD